MRLWNIGACVLALLVVSCGGTTDGVEVEQQKAGTLRLPLISPSPDGKLYRLVGATFDITGPQTVTLTDTSAETVQTTLLAGSYTIELKGAWHLESIDAPGTAVPAQMLSPNPLPFFVTKGETSEVRFLFKMPGKGDANVGIKVDNGGWLAGTLHFTQREDPTSGPSVFDELMGQSIPFVISFESATLTKSNWSFKELMVEADPPHTIQFGGPHSALLERVASSMRDVPFTFTLRATPEGFVQFNNMNMWGPAFMIQMNESAPFAGKLDAEGFPTAQYFEVESNTFIRSVSAYYDGVMGPANVNGSP
ncbi:hypothetical protein F0U60_07275 [Archangium minus]|uniref:Lipoprotein n=1 Tax=Archangium minus TaxID=83450 RepID=A0ABY9WJD1_9BACT|nr:hypothetical protein F0U60_07275 [Archangium minus]